MFLFACREAIVDRYVYFLGTHYWYFAREWRLASVDSFLGNLFGKNILKSKFFL